MLNRQIVMQKKSEALRISMTIQRLVVMQIIEVYGTDLVQGQGLKKTEMVSCTVVHGDDKQQFSSSGNYFLYHSNFNNVLAQNSGHHQALLLVVRSFYFDAVGQQIS
jgi:hypothetical protein